ncbi:protein-L-isoaspartate O-methyltransferase, partial [Spirochaetota bacterium]
MSKKSNKKLEKFLKVLKSNKIKKNIRDAISSIDREKFFDPFFKKDVFEFGPLPVGCGENSDDVIIMAKMIELLSPKKNWRILEVGTGSGYSTAVLASLVKEVVTVEYHEGIAKEAKERLVSQGFFNIRFYTGDATEMTDDMGKFDGIIIFPACVKRPFSIIPLLKYDGPLVFPMGTPLQQ